MLHAKIAPTAIGPLKLVSNGEALVELWVPGTFDAAGESANDAVLEEAARQLREYFAGKRRAFELPLAARGTAFQQRVWEAVSAIPYGQTTSYGHIASTINEAGKARAV